MKVGDVVTFLHPTDRGRWPLSRISKVWPGRDGQVQLVEVTLPQLAGGPTYARLPDRKYRRDVGAVALLLPAGATLVADC